MTSVEMVRCEFDAPQLVCKAVTVYADRAEVKRLVKTDLKPGTNEVVVKRLPRSIDSDSVRVEGRGKATICEVQYQDRHVHHEEAGVKEQEAQLRTEINKMKTQKQEIEDLLKMLMRKGEVLDGVATQVAKGPTVKEESKEPTGGFSLNTTSLDALDSFLSFYAEKVVSVQESVRDTQRKLEKINDEMQLANRKLRELSGGYKDELSREVSIILDVSEAGEVELDVSYVVGGASWSPSYDIRVYTGGDKKVMKVHYHGMIQQNTGEDWTDTQLSLSTAMPNIGGQIPELKTLKASFVPPPPPPPPAAPPMMKRAGRNSSFGFSSGGGMMHDQVMMVEEAMPMAMMMECAVEATTDIYHFSPPPPPPRPVMAPQRAMNSSLFGGFGMAGDGDVMAQSTFMAPPMAMAIWHTPKRQPLMREFQKKKKAKFSLKSKRAPVSTSMEEDVYGYTTGMAYSMAKVESHSDSDEDMRPGVMIDQVSQIKESVISTSFRIARPTTIPSDSTSHKVNVTIVDLEPKFEHATVPCKTEFTYIKAKVLNSSSYPFLAGPVSVFLDNNFISKSTLKAVSPQEEFECSLGVDPAVRVDYKPERKFHEDTGYFSKTSVTITEQRIELKNTRQEKVTVKLMERLPLSTEDKLKIILIKPELPKPEKGSNGEVAAHGVKLNRDHILEWDIQLDPSETKTVEVKYRIEHPPAEKVRMLEV